MLVTKQKASVADGDQSIPADLSPTGSVSSVCISGRRRPHAAPMMKMAHFFYKLPNVSGPDQMPESDHVLVGASLRGTAFCSSPVVAPG